MWINSGEVYINGDHVDYVLFEAIEAGYKATVFFQSGDSLNFEHTNLEILKQYFKEVFNGQRKTS
jgi:hypothetical protein